MIKRPLLLAVLLPALLAGGCAASADRGLESVHQPVVDRADYAFNLQVAGDDLATGEPQRLSGWLASLRLGYGDRVSVDGAVRDAGVRDRVAEVVAGYGLLLADQAPVSPTPVAPGTVRVVVSRMQAGVPGCPNWSGEESFTFEAKTSTNHGCAVNRNLAAMIARPEDLVRGTGGNGYDAATGFRAIDSYRKASTTGSGGTAVKAESAGGK